MYMISIDGACRRNGKPDCVSSGGVFVYEPRVSGNDYCESLSCSEYNSTNQRGELSALIKALSFIESSVIKDETVQIITDSEYIFNAMTKEWYKGWASRQWLTAAGEPVKNADLWQTIYWLVDRLHYIDIVYYHIKGHCIPFGKVTADRLLTKDPSGKLLLQETYKKFDASVVSKRNEFEAAQSLSIKNNGFRLPDDVFRRFVVINTVVDAIATKEVEVADSQS